MGEGFEEYFYSDHLCLIEWPEKVCQLVPENAIKVQITQKEEKLRQIRKEKISFLF